MKKVLFFSMAFLLTMVGMWATGSLAGGETTDAGTVIDESFVEIPQSQGKEYDDFARATVAEGDGYTTYTCNSDLQIAIKMMNVDVEGADYVLIKFAEPVAAGWKLAFWSGQDLVDVPAGSTEYKYVFADDAKCGVTNGVLPQICMMTFFGGYTAPLEAKVVGIYKHMIASEPAGPAEFVSITPEAGSKVDLDTEYTITFSAPVKYSLSLSDISIGLNPFSNDDGAFFTMSEDKKTITCKLDPETLALYGVNSVEDAISKFGSNVTLHFYKVKDLETGEPLEYNDPDDEEQFTFTYRLGDPVLNADPADGATVSELSEILFSCSEGIQLANEEKNILVMKNKQQILSVPASALVAVENEWGFFDEDEDDDWGVGGETSIAYYKLQFETPLTENGTYEVYVPEGVFTLAGSTLNATSIYTYTVGEAVAEAINVTPAPGTVTSLKDFVLTYGDKGAIVPSYGEDLTITNAEGEVVATISQDDLRTGETEEDYDSYFNPIRLYISIDEITTPGTYTLNIPAGALNVSENYDSSEATSFTWTIEAPMAKPSIDPAEGTVESLNKFTLTFPEDAFIGTDGMTQAILKNEAGETVATGEPSYDWDIFNIGIITLNTTVTEPGKYTLVLPAGTFALDEESTKLTPEFTFEYTIEEKAELPVPAFSELVTDGETIYYLYNVETHAFVTGGNNWGTRASGNIEKGNQVKVSANGETYKISDLVGSNWNAFDVDGNKDSWVDGQGRAGDGTWVITPNGDNTYTITNTAAGDLKWGIQLDMANSRVQFKSNAAYGYTWAFVSADDYNAYMEVIDKEGINALLAANTPIVEEAMIEEYNVANAVALEEMKKLIDGTNVYGEGYDAYVQKYEDYKAKYEANELKEFIVNPAAATGWHASTDYNFLLTPWTIGGKSANNWDASLYINTWSVEGTTDGSNFLVPFFEYWTGDSNSLGENTISTTLTGLEAGKTYEVSVWTRVRMKNGAEGDATGITLQAGEGEAVDVCAGSQVGTSQFRLTQAYAQGVADEEGNLVVSFNVAADNNISWLSYKDVYYTQLPDPEPVLNYYNLTADDFKEWDDCGANANVVGPGYGAYDLNNSCGLPYGDGNVDKKHYADLSDCSVLAITVSEGTPRPLFNRDIDNGQAPDHLIDIPNNADQTAKYQTVVDNGDGTTTYIINVAQIVADYGYAHLHCVKGAYWQNTTVTSLMVGKEESIEPEPETWTKTGYVVPAEGWTGLYESALGQAVTVSGVVGSNEITISQDSNGYHNVIKLVVNDDQTLASISYNGSEIDYENGGGGYFDFGNSYYQNIYSSYYNCFASADQENGYATISGYFYDNAGNSVWSFVNIAWWDGIEEYVDSLLNPVTPPATSIAGTWYENTSGQYYVDGWEDFTVNGNVVTITENEDGTVVIANLLGSGSSINGTVDYEAGTITISAGQSLYYDIYDWTIGSADGETADIVGTINSDGSISLNKLDIYYDGYDYFNNQVITLKREAPEVDTDVVSTWADLADGKVYTLTTQRAGLIWDGESTNLCTTVNPTAVEADATNPNQQFIILKSETLEGQVYVYNVGANKWMLVSGNQAALAESLAQEGLWTMKESGNSEYPLMLDASTGTHFNMGGSSQITIDGWSTPDAGNRFAIKAVGDSDAALVASLREQINAFETGIDTIAASTLKNGKFFQNGKIIIVRNGVKYNVNGVAIK